MSTVRDYAVLYLGPGGKKASTVGGGNAVLAGGQHRLDSAEHLAALDATTLDASTSAHGLLPKLSGTALDSLRGDGTWANPAWKQSVRVATAVAGTLASDFENGDTVGAITLATGDRILIKDQADATENGIYVVAASGAPARAADMDAAAEFPGAWVPVLEGTYNHGTLWRCDNVTAPTIGTTSIHFAQFAATAGGGALYAIDSASGVGTYQVLSFTPDTAAEEIDTCSVAAADGEVLIEAYITAAGVPGVTLIPSGAWEFDTWRKVDNAVGDSRLVFRVYKYETDTTETELFNVVGEEINDTTVTSLSVETISVRPEYVLASTDRILVKVYGKTTSVAARTISYYHSGTTHYSHVNTPLSAPGAAGGGDVATDAIWDAAGDLAVGTGADTASALSVGSNDEVLTVVAGVPAWAAAAGGGDITTDAAWAAKGDLIVGTANDTAGILTAGTNDYVLTAASGETTGLKWAAASGGAQSLPADIPGLWSWFAADNLSGYSDDDPVTEWPNAVIASQGFSAIAATAGTYKTGIINSLPVIRVAATSRYKFTSLAIPAYGMTFVVVFKASSIAPSYTGVLGWTATGDSGGFFVKSNGKSALYAASNIYDGSGAVTYDNTNWNYSLVTFTGTTWVTRRNGTLDKSTTTSTNTLGTSFTAQLGNQTVAGRGLTGDIAELLYYSRPLTSTEITAIESYITTKYAL